MSIASERLKKVRIDSGLSQKEMADKLFIPLRTYQSYERGERDLSTAVVLAICLTFNISSDYLIGRTTSERTEQQEHLAELVEAGDPSDTTRLLMGLPKRNTLDPDNFKTLGVINVAYKVPENKKSPHEEDDLTDDEKKELKLFAEFLRYRRSRQKGD